MTETVRPDRLPLAFAERERPPSDRLPLPLGNRAAPPPTKPPRRNPPVFEFGVSYGSQEAVANCLRVQAQPAAVSGCLPLTHGHSRNLAACTHSQTAPMPAVQVCAAPSVAPAAAVTACAVQTDLRPASLRGCGQGGQAAAYRLHGCGRHPAAPTLLLSGCLKPRYGQAATAVTCLPAHTDGHLLESCRRTATGNSMQPPCYWYDIPLPPPPPPTRVSPCAVYPPHRLPLPMASKRFTVAAHSLPLPISCRNDQLLIPVLDTYIMLHTVTAAINGDPVEILSASVRADTGGYCWQGSIGLAPADFERFDWHHSAEPPLVQLNINGETFVFLAEEYGDNRRFASRSYTVSGRSQTAKLGADYAQAAQGMVAQTLNARQIADGRLRHSGFALEHWDIPDWLVPKDTYSLTDKTPIDVLQDIARAAGGFVESHPSEPRLSLRPRYKVASWRLQQQHADVAAPDSVILSVSGRVRRQARYNSVYVYPTRSDGKAYNIYRTGSSQQPRAPLLSHALYTDAKVCRAAGEAALSASGTHKEETVVLPFAPDKYGIVRAQLGQVWRFDEPDGAWLGVITGVQLDVRIQDGAPDISQTLTVDRYLDG